MKFYLKYMRLSIVIITLCLNTNLFAQAGILIQPSVKSGIVTTGINPVSNSQAKALIVQSDGKIVEGGNSFGQNGNEFTIARFNKNGTHDYSFGINGIVTVSAGREKME